MRRWLALAFIGLFAYGVFMLLGWPAERWLAHVPDIEAEQVSGHLRQGQAQHLQLPTASLDRLSWQWQPSALLAGRLGWQLRLSDQGEQLSAQVSLSWRQHWHLDAVQGQLPLATVAALAGHSLPFLNGQLVVDLPTVRINAQGVVQHIEGVVQLVDGQLPSGAPLGTVQAEFGTQADMIIAELRDTGGPMRLEATLTLSPDGRYRLAGELGARDGADPNLRQTLNLLGQPAPGGQRQFNLGGYWLPH